MVNVCLFHCLEHATCFVRVAAQRFGAEYRFAGRGGRQEFWALRDVSFQLEHGETVGIVGHNGSGKSTILKMVAGIFTPTSGKVIAVVQPHRFTRLQSLFEEFCTCFNDADVVIMAAAVADYAPRLVAEHKVKKDGNAPTIELTENPDILRTLVETRKAGQVIVGGRFGECRTRRSSRCPCGVPVGGLAGPAAVVGRVDFWGL